MPSGSFGSIAGKRAEVILYKEVCSAGGVLGGILYICAVIHVSHSVLK